MVELSSLELSLKTASSQLFSCNHLSQREFWRSQVSSPKFLIWDIHLQNQPLGGVTWKCICVQQHKNYRTSYPSCKKVLTTKCSNSLSRRFKKNKSVPLKYMAIGSKHPKTKYLLHFEPIVRIWVPMHLCSNFFWLVFICLTPIFQE